MSANDPKRTLLHAVRGCGIMVLRPHGGMSHDENSILVAANSGSTRRQCGFAFSFTPYGWMTSVNGNVTAPGKKGIAPRLSFAILW